MTPKGVPVVNNAETLRFSVPGVSSEPSVGAVDGRRIRLRAA